ncbi:hypothetical protein R1sor_008564 [Riccia sorocarpa]|uniref:Uncharacterized protein n=1 Tax=Riccia sorocarpa TaxID=122646 RepID=A0ABD3HU73_9MARC
MSSRPFPHRSKVDLAKRSCSSKVDYSCTSNLGDDGGCGGSCLGRMELHSGHSGSAWSCIPSLHSGRRAAANLNAATAAAVVLVLVFVVWRRRPASNLSP